MQHIRQKILEVSFKFGDLAYYVFILYGEIALGPAGFVARFFKNIWPVIQSNVHANQSFFNSGKLLDEVNATIVTLVPKVINPLSMGGL